MAMRGTSQYASSTGTFRRATDAAAPFRHTGLPAHDGGSQAAPRCTGAAQARRRAWRSQRRRSRSRQPGHGWAMHRTGRTTALPDRLAGDARLAAGGAAAAVAPGALVALVIFIGAALMFASRDGSWTAGLLVRVTLSISLIPGEFAVAWSFNACVLRLSRSGAARQPQAIEPLDPTTVLLWPYGASKSRRAVAQVASAAFSST